ncbi:nuclear transcription factor Y subunit beta isoform X2 [Scaptodrosophila lebanonensis]|uniref:Nuclear transcription factor Y subunit beta isoform X2 n=1 Tax=Drosophila lebanonensis TaxID=7225 RepID=A0A6J2T4J5_DROLE|nr:nuclear transcription factor Y subunit beta isoform X2 [Scaptodrosophila lebanonensis]
MSSLDYKAALLLAFIACASAQRVVPGVNPQHYQQVPQQVPQHHPPPPQHQQQQYQNVAPGVPPQQYQYEQVPVQQQQQQQQYQQVPVQQQQNQPVQQHPPQGQHAQQVHQQQQPAGAHHGHHGPQQVLNTGNIQHERAHIQEHMQVPIDTSKMSEAELQFHYFKMHDSDNNNKLDGCELIKSLIHWHVDDKHGAEKPPEGEKVEPKVYTDSALEEVIEYVLKTMDHNNDGYVDYTEYRKNESNLKV